MKGYISGQPDKRVPIAISVLAAVLALLGVHQMELPGAGSDRSVQMTSTMVSLPAR